MKKHQTLYFAGAVLVATGVYMYFTKRTSLLKTNKAKTLPPKEANV